VRVIALEVSSAAGDAPGGVPGAIRNLVGALTREDPGTRYLLCSRFSRWRKGKVFRSDAPNTETRVLQDPLNGFLLRGARLLHSMGIFLPVTPRIPKLLTVHDLNAVRNVQWVSERWHERRSGRIEKALARADHVVTYSAFTAGEIREHYGMPAERVHPILLGVDTEKFRPADPAAVERTRARFGDFVLSIGILAPRKNFPRLIEALAPLPRLRLVLVGRAGDGEEGVKDAIERFGMAKRVDWMPTVPHAELVSLLSAARACAVASLYEGFGLTVLEAMACGTPVVCSNASSLPEVAADAALSVDAQRPEALRDALERVVESPDLAADLRARGFARARELSWPRAARELRALYRSVSGT
jgi:glycosyltransferase involved in cell wall biosynthesis